MQRLTHNNASAEPVAGYPLKKEANNPDRHVVWYASEYKSYGPDGCAVTFLPDSVAGGWKQQYFYTDNVGSIKRIYERRHSGVTDTIAYTYSAFGERGGDSLRSRVGYIGKEHDYESGYLNLGIRLYEPGRGLFVAPDPLWGVQLGHSAYHYSFNNPLSYSDPTGLLAGGGARGGFGHTPAWDDREWYGGVSPHDATSDTVDRKDDREARERRERQQKLHGGEIYNGNNIFFAAWLHYQIGRRTDFHVATSCLDLSGITMDMPIVQQIVKNGRGSIDLYKQQINQTSLAIGSVKFVHIADNEFSLEPDTYDFDIRWNEGITKRNIATAFAGLLHGPAIDNTAIPIYHNGNNISPFIFPSVVQGGPFKIIFHGTVHIKHK